MLLNAQVSVGGFKTVAVSPHFDDVALSLSGLIVQAGVPTAVVTVHGGPPDNALPVSEWDADCGFLTAGSAHRARLAEDAESCQVMGATSLTLPNADGPYRGLAPLAGLQELVRESATAAQLYLPAGIEQPDHRRVRDQAIAALADQPGVRPFFYADLPYASVAPDWFKLDEAGLASPDAWPAEVRGLERFYPAGLELVTRAVITGSGWERKRQAVLRHASQLALVASMGEVAGSRPLLAVDGLLSVEAVWRPRAGASAFET